MDTVNTVNFDTVKLRNDLNELVIDLELSFRTHKAEIERLSARLAERRWEYTQLTVRHEQALARLKNLKKRHAKTLLALQSPRLAKRQRRKTR